MSVSRKIYDCFCFFNELDILEIRLNVLYEHVDYFVLVESSVTHTGREKPYYFEENKEKFSRFNDKIIHLKITDTPDIFNNLKSIDNPSGDEIHVNDIIGFMLNQNPRKLFDVNYEIEYGRDFFQKECIRRGLNGCSDEDIIIFSDCDEIPNPMALQSVLKDFRYDIVYALKERTFYYYFNVLKQEDWLGSRITSYGRLKNYSTNQMRAAYDIIVENGGWHFSFMGGKENVRLKIESYSAQELNNVRVITEIENNIRNNVDPFFRGHLRQVPIDASYPQYIIDNMEKYRHHIK
jgi:beta-1,4-mannosyl-glycoprotein beta-1,4-N-acetylglucosaminyltransferase